VLASTLGAILFSLLASAAPTQDPRRVRFAYELPDSSETCPDEAKLRAGVVARLGYDAFDAAAEEELKVSLRRTGHELEALITITDGQGRVRAERRLISRHGDCAELASSVELAVSIAIDPFRVAEPPEPAVPAPPQTEPTPTVPTAPAPRLLGQIKAGALVGQGTAPTRTLGFVLGGNVRRGRWSLGLEARADLPRDRGLPVGAIRTTSLLGSLSPCVHWRGATACALITAGALHAQGRGLVDAQRITRPTVAMGARLAYTLPLSRRFSLLFHGDVTTPIVTTELDVDHEGVWTTPPVAAALGIDLGFNFP
jgi:hypothetical protein